MAIEIEYFVKKEKQPMFRWFPDYDMDGVSVSDEDRANGSPKYGDMIAFNPNNPADQWLVEEKFFSENYTKAES